MTSAHQSSQLNRDLYLDGSAKTTNERVFYMADLLYAAIHAGEKVTFKYIGYNNRKQKIYKHNHQIYSVSPYVMLWNSDCYYVLGYSDSHGGVVKFRVDQIATPELSDIPAVPPLQDFDSFVYGTLRVCFRCMTAPNKT